MRCVCQTRCAVLVQAREEKLHEMESWRDAQHITCKIGNHSYWWTVGKLIKVIVLSLRLSCAMCDTMCFESAGKTVWPRCWSEGLNTLLQCVSFVLYDSYVNKTCHLGRQTQQELHNRLVYRSIIIISGVRVHMSPLDKSPSNFIHSKWPHIMLPLFLSLT